MMLGKSNILLNRFVKLIEENHQEITERYMNDLLKNPDTIAYQNLDREKIYEASDLLYRDLSKWITKKYTKEKIEEKYKKNGLERYNQGIPFSQAYKALILQMRHLWLFVMDKIYDDSTVYKEALELNNRVTLFFERAAFFMLKGFELNIYDKR